jgi:hypothetical protein
MTRVGGGVVLPVCSQPALISLLMDTQHVGSSLSLSHQIRESSPAGVKTKVSSMDHLLERPQTDFNVLVDISILAAAAHLLLAGDEHPTSACVAESSLWRLASHSSASINAARSVLCSRQLLSNCAASNSSLTADAPFLAIAKYQEKQGIQQAPESQTI